MLKGEPGSEKAVSTIYDRSRRPERNISCTAIKNELIETKGKRSKKRLKRKLIKNEEEEINMTSGIECELNKLSASDLSTMLFKGNIRFLIILCNE